MNEQKNILRISKLFGEKELIDYLLLVHKNNKSVVSKILNIDRKTLYNRITIFNKYEKEINDYKTYRYAYISN